MKMFLGIISTILFSVVVVLAQDEVKFGGFCNGNLLLCSSYQNTVACINRSSNESTGIDNCVEGIGNDMGRCQCSRHCDGGQYIEDGEFDPAKDVCVGFVGAHCTASVPYCTANAACNTFISQCLCVLGYNPDPVDGKRCVQQNMIYQ